MKRYFMPILVLISMLVSGLLVSCSQPAQIPYFKASGETINLTNNDNAYAHTWQEVVTFLQRDTTDEEAYRPEHECGFFAEELHNRAEYYGFRTAFVVVEFETGEPHALNAFDTIDYGLIYVDCTGKGQFDMPVTDTEFAPVEHWDKIAYIKEGEKFSLISLGYTEMNFSYEWHTVCRKRLTNFERDLTQFIDDSQDYEEELYYANLPFLYFHHSPGEPITPGEAGHQYILRQEHHDWFVNADVLAVYYSCPLEEIGSYQLGHSRRLENEARRLLNEKERLMTEWQEEVSGYNWEESDSPVVSIQVYW